MLLRELYARGHRSLFLLAGIRAEHSLVLLLQLPVAGALPRCLSCCGLFLRRSGGRFCHRRLLRLPFSLFVGRPVRFLVGIFSRHRIEHVINLLIHLFSGLIDNSLLHSPFDLLANPLTDLLQTILKRLPRGAWGTQQ